MSYPKFTVSRIVQSPDTILAQSRSKNLIVPMHSRVIFLSSIAQTKHTHTKSLNKYIVNTHFEKYSRLDANSKIPKIRRGRNRTLRVSIRYQFVLLWYHSVINKTHTLIAGNELVLKEFDSQNVYSLFFLIIKLFFGPMVGILKRC